MTGTESYYTEYAGNEIMFHVSTMLPFVASDAQQVRAGHANGARGTAR